MKKQQSLPCPPIQAKLLLPESLYYKAFEEVLELLASACPERIYQPTVQTHPVNAFVPSGCCSRTTENIHHRQI